MTLIHTANQQNKCLDFRLSLWCYCSFKPSLDVMLCHWVKTKILQTF